MSSFLQSTEEHSDMLNHGLDVSILMVIFSEIVPMRIRLIVSWTG